ncbi:hypothetical protein A7U60_g3771 [Sanghuangporus baumii]|uniref:Uncharacterized protein n=1 Tax=Sanghuangporus baumii TaxID=108892 RepID=A0A9Q5N9P0_SANBA|nr:hypothetical protein A7U60_g3771 [Sanghuangporus baumii]
MSERAPDGTRLFDPQTGLLIPFESHSDALLAQLTLQCGMSKQLFNILLNILLDPSFSLDELNLKSATDIDVRISEYRRGLAEARSYKIADGSSPKAEPSSIYESLGIVGMPSIVFDLVLDQMIAELHHFSTEIDATPLSVPSDEPSTSLTHHLQSTFKQMSLVHRSWTEPAQRALRRRIVLTNRRTLRGFARSPACGTGVREFVYKIPKSEVCTFFHEASVSREHWCTLASVISRLMTLRYFCLSVESAHLADLSGLDVVLNAIEGLKSLEGLWMLSIRDHCPYLPKLCATISKLPDLRILGIWNWTCPRRPSGGLGDSQERQERILELTPSSSLRVLQIRDEYLTTPPAYLSWLFQPRKSYSLETLDLHITFSRPLPLTPLDPTFPNAESNYTSPRVDSAHLLAALAPLLPSLSTLAIKLFYLDTSTASGAYLHDSDMQKILERCTNLKRMRLHRLRAGTHVDGVRLRLPPSLSLGTDPGPGEPLTILKLTTPLILPQTLEELHMHYTYSAINWRTQDFRLWSTLSASQFPNLMRVLVSNGETDLEGGKGKVVDPRVDLPRTSELCARLGVELVVYDRVWVNRYVVEALS